MGTCEKCRWWSRGTTYTQEPYGHIPERVAWSTVQTGEYRHQAGECRIAAPYRCGSYFFITYEFQGCGEFRPTPTGEAV